MVSNNRVTLDRRQRLTRCMLRRTKLQLQASQLASNCLCQLTVPHIKLQVVLREPSCTRWFKQWQQVVVCCLLFCCPRCFLCWPDASKLGDSIV